MRGFIRIEFGVQSVELEVRSSIFNYQLLKIKEMFNNQYSMFNFQGLGKYVGL